VRVVADTHAIVWYGGNDPRLTVDATAALEEAEATDGIVVSAATLIDCWYVTQTTQGLTVAQLDDLEDQLDDPAINIELAAIDRSIFDAYNAVPRSVLADPWDRLIVSTAMAFGLPLVTSDRPITKSGLVPIISQRTTTSLTPHV
jgi:PIN domain nuclease of toxin-antitoxin system